MILRAHVGCEMIDSQQGTMPLIDYDHLISNKFDCSFLFNLQEMNCSQMHLNMKKKMGFSMKWKAK